MPLHQYRKPTFKQGFVCLILWLCPALVQPAHAQAVLGDWHGELQVSGTKLPLAWHITPAGDTAIQATLDSPRQNVYGRLASKASYDVAGRELTLELANLRYVARLQPGDSVLEGIFTQASFEAALTLRRGLLRGAARPQEPKPPFPYLSEELSIAGAETGVQLEGTLTRAAGPQDAPLLVLINGSGPHDRNSTILEHSPFWVLADQLSRAGIHVFRYDERGVAASTGDFSQATTADLAADAAAIIRYFRAQPAFAKGPIGVLGHSEGGLIATLLCQHLEAAQQPDFLIYFASPGLPGHEIISRQLALVMGEELLAANKSLIDELTIKAREPGGQRDWSQQVEQALITFYSGLDHVYRKQLPDSATLISRSMQQMAKPWYRFYLQYDPVPDLRRLSAMPVLILNGTLDRQVYWEENTSAIRDALRAGGNQQVAVRVFDGLNHLFQPAKTGSPLEYGEIEITIAPEVIEALIAWVQALP